MLNQTLYTFLLSLTSILTSILLTISIGLSSPFPGSLLIAEHTPDHAAAIAQPATPPTSSPQLDAPSSPQPAIKGDRDPKLKDPKPTQANPSVPYDPYDYDAIRELNHEIYGEVNN